MNPHDRSTDGESLRRRLYEAMQDPTVSLEEKRRRALELGCEYLGVENGYVQRRDGDVHEVVASVGDASELVPRGATLDRSTTYCRHTMDSNSSLAISNAVRQGWEDDPAYREHGLECYLGTTIFARGEAYGTVCFVSREPRDGAFRDEERAFVELVARLLGRELETARHDRELEAREAALSQSESKYESLVETAPDAIVLVDTATDAIVEANAAAADLTGYDREALRGMAVHDLHAIEDREAYETELARIVESGDAVDRLGDGTPLCVSHRDGDEIPVAVSASVVDLDAGECVQLIVRDISERRARERELRTKNRAMEEASVGITIADATANDRPLVYANREFERLTGYDREDVLGQNCRFLQGPETDAAEVERVREALAAETPLTTELLNYRADGTPFWNELTLAPVTGADDELTHVVGLQRDVTQRKRRERLIGVLNRVLRHNLRNDMNVVSGYASTIADRTDGEASEMATRIERTASALVALSEKARTLESDVREPTTPEARETFPGVEFDVETPDECRAVSTASLKVALRELGENAVRHGASTTVRYRVEEDESGVTIHVEDEGAGLSESERRTLETGRETPLEHGQGLGLWLVNWLVTAMGGDVTATVDDGTTVTVRLRSASGATGRSGRPAAFGAQSG